MKLSDDFYWRYLKLTRPFRNAKRRAVRRLRYGPVPPEGWGEGWRVLVFRYGEKPSRTLHVLAPVKGFEFDWDVLREHVRGKPWPAYNHQAGVLTGVMGWAGHHIFVNAEGDENERVPMDKLIPGAFKGGVTKTILLTDVQQPNESLRLGD